MRPAIRRSSIELPSNLPFLEYAVALQSMGPVTEETVMRCSSLMALIPRGTSSSRFPSFKSKSWNVHIKPPDASAGAGRLPGTHVTHLSQNSGRFPYILLLRDSFRESAKNAYDVSRLPQTGLLQLLMHQRLSLMPPHTLALVPLIERTSFCSPIAVRHLPKLFEVIGCLTLFSSAHLL